MMDCSSLPLAWRRTCHPHLDLHKCLPAEVWRGRAQRQRSGSPGDSSCDQGHGLHKKVRVMLADAAPRILEWWEVRTPWDSHDKKNQRPSLSDWCARSSLWMPSVRCVQRWCKRNRTWSRVWHPSFLHCEVPTFCILELPFDFMWQKQKS